MGQACRPHAASQAYDFYPMYHPLAPLYTGLMRPSLLEESPRGLGCDYLVEYREEGRSAYAG